ncbi:MAG: DNA topoisomerase 4 subunit A [Clostridia bacterium]|nr:DNA topoisomerase 4 subunit A [Clostridia bacterium]
MSKGKQVSYDENIIDMAATEVMHDAFMTYAEHVTMERALPRVEDGLKPVQRRILYTLNELGITPDKPYKKCARIVGEALGKYHPAGDSSVYDAMTRMAQDFSMRMPLVDGHGNFGSVDGDPPAAMRYTEARMSSLALEMLRDLQKDTVPFRPNYDDTDVEPDLLPARYPNLLVNGASGIAVGLATNIPPHNLGEVVDSVIYRMNKPGCTLDEIMKIVPAPDFPTGGYVVEGTGLRDAYETGRGRIQIRARAHIEKQDNGKSLIVVTEMPYEVKKSALLEKALQIVEAKRDLFGAVEEIRDESDREGMRAVFEIKKGVDPEKILQLLYKYTDLQTTFGINMMAIADGSPRQLGLLDVLDGYIRHQKNVVRRRTAYDLERCEKREHVLEGLQIAVVNIDRVIKIIRGSKNPEAAKKGLMDAFELTQAQAQAILDMRLSRLTGLETIELEKELAQLRKEISTLRSVLENESELVAIIRRELRDIKKKYDDPRRTELLSAEQGEIRIDEMALLPREECTIVLTRGGGLKRMAPKALQRALENPPEEEKLKIRTLLSSNTANRIYVFTSTGQGYVIPAMQIPEQRLRDPGKSLSALVSGVARGEEIVALFDDRELEQDAQIWFATAGGLVKPVKAGDLKSRKNRMSASGLREGDRLIAVERDRPGLDNLTFVSSDGYVVTFPKEGVPLRGRTAVGVPGVRLAPDAQAVAFSQTAATGQRLVLITDRGRAKQFRTEDLRPQARNGRGSRLMVLKGDGGTKIAAALTLDQITSLTVAEPGGQVRKISSGDLPVSAGSPQATQVVELTNGIPVAGAWVDVDG